MLALAPFAASRVYVLEVSSYQIDLAPSLNATVGILLNVTEDHLDRHGTMENYAAIKERLAAECREGRHRGHRRRRRLYPRGGGPHSSASGKHVVRVSVESIVARRLLSRKGTASCAPPAARPQAVADLAGIGSLRGSHNAQNAACAVAACVALGVDLPAIQKGLASFPGLAHRMQQVGRKGNVLFVNDSKATNANSAAKALASFNDIYWIAGGKPKTGGIASLAEFFPRIRKAYLIGEAAEEFAQTLEGKVPYEIAGVLSAAVDAAARDAGAAKVKEPVVLLSPACASFDQYRNFEVRGAAFTRPRAGNNRRDRDC